MNEFNKTLAGWDLSAAASAMIGAKLSPEMSVAIDVWIDQQPEPKPSRSEVVRRALTMLLSDQKPNVGRFSRADVDLPKRIGSRTNGVRKPERASS
jgi:Arc/MetJ-type ribon-helix-helix transcriptional regulator